MQVGSFITSLALDPFTVLIIDEIDQSEKIVWATDEDGNGFEVKFSDVSLQTPVTLEY